MKMKLKSRSDICKMAAFYSGVLLLNKHNLSVGTGYDTLFLTHVNINRISVIVCHSCKNTIYDDT